MTFLGWGKRDPFKGSTGDLQLEDQRVTAAESPGQLRLFHPEISGVMGPYLWLVFGPISLEFFC